MKKVEANEEGKVVVVVVAVAVAWEADKKRHYKQRKSLAENVCACVFCVF